MTERKLRLLLLSAGSLTTHNIIDTLGGRRERCVLIGANSEAEAAGNFRCDTVYLVPPAASGAAYIDRIAELILREAPDLVIPTRDDDILALATLKERPLRTRAVLLTGSVGAAQNWNDKVETARFAARHVLPFAPTAQNAREALGLLDTHRLPLIGKPRSGNASHGVVLLRSVEEIERAFAASTDLIAQPFLDPGDNMDTLAAPFEAGLPLFFSFPESAVYFFNVIVGPDAAVSAVFAGVSTQVGGRGVRTARAHDTDLLNLGRAYATAAAAEGWRGPLNAQLKRTPEGRFVPYEVNGRFGGGTSARACLGVDDVCEVFTRFLPDVAFPAISTAVADVAQKYPRSYPIPRDGPEALRATGKWSSETTRAPARARRAKGKAKLRLLFLSAGSLLAQKLIETLESRRDHCVLIGTNSLADAAGNFRCDSVRLVPPAASGERYIASVAEAIQEERPDLVIPCRDDDVLTLAMLRERSPDIHSVLLAGSVAAARIVNDKVETARFAARHALPFAPTATDVQGALELAETYALPLIGKPRRGYASRGVLLLRSIAEIERAFAANPDLIAQPYLDPPGNMSSLVAPHRAGLPFFFSFPEQAVYALQVIVGPQGEVCDPFAVVAAQVGGAAVGARRCEEPALLALGPTYGAAAAAEGWRGPLNVQMKRTPDGRFIAFELNGRFSGTTAERIFMGRDEIGNVVTRFLPQANFPPAPAADADIAQRHLCSYAVPRSGLAQLETTGSWSLARGVPRQASRRSRVRV